MTLGFSTHSPSNSSSRHPNYNQNLPESRTRTNSSSSNSKNSYSSSRHNELRTFKEKVVELTTQLHIEKARRVHYQEQLQESQHKNADLEKRVLQMQEWRQEVQTQISDMQEALREEIQQFHKERDAYLRKKRQFRQQKQDLRLKTRLWRDWDLYQSAVYGSRCSREKKAPNRKINWMDERFTALFECKEWRRIFDGVTEQESKRTPNSLQSNNDLEEEQEQSQDDSFLQEAMEQNYQSSLLRSPPRKKRKAPSWPLASTTHNNTSHLDIRKWNDTRMDSFLNIDDSSSTSSLEEDHFLHVTKLADQKTHRPHTAPKNASYRSPQKIGKKKLQKMSPNIHNTQRSTSPRKEPSRKRGHQGQLPSLLREDSKTASLLEDTTSLLNNPPSTLEITRLSPRKDPPHADTQSIDTSRSPSVNLYQFGSQNYNPLLKKDTKQSRRLHPPKNAAIKRSKSPPPVKSLAKWKEGRQLMKKNQALIDFDESATTEM